MTDFLLLQGLQSTRLLHPWDSPGKHTGVGCHFPLQGIFPTQGSSPGLLHCRLTLNCLSHQAIKSSVGDRQKNTGSATEREMKLRLNLHSKHKTKTLTERVIKYVYCHRKTAGNFVWFLCSVHLRIQTKGSVPSCTFTYMNIVTAYIALP